MDSIEIPFDEYSARVQKHLEASKNLFAQGDFAGCESEIDQLLAASERLD